MQNGSLPTHQLALIPTRRGGFAVAINYRERAERTARSEALPKLERSLKDGARGETLVSPRLFPALPPLSFRQELLADANVCGRDLDELIVVDVLECLL